MTEGSPQRFVQPALERPNLKNPLLPGKIRSLQSEWMRTAGPQLGIDPEKFVLGLVLNAVASDDNMLYGVHMFQPKPPAVGIAKIEAKERLDWEIAMHETPADIKERLRALRVIVLETDWLDPEKFAKVAQARETVAAYVHERLAADPALAEAEKYATTDPQVQNLWRPHWEEFIGSPPTPREE